MKKSIKKLIMLLVAALMVISFLPVMTLANETIEPASVSNPKLNVTYATKEAVEGGYKVTSQPGDNTNGMRVYVNVKNAENTEAYAYDSYLVYTVDIEVNERYETNQIATDTYARMYFGTSIVSNIPLSALGTTGTSSKLTLISTPDKEVYLYYNSHLLGRAPSQAAPDTISDIRYYEKSAVDAEKSNILTFTNPTVLHYDKAYEVDDILKLHETKITGKTVNTIRSGYGTASGNTFTSVTTAGGRSGWGIWVQCGFESKLVPGRNLIYVEGSVKVDNRVDTTPRTENCPITLSFEGTQASNTANVRRQYFNIECALLEEGNEYPLTIIIDETNNAHVWINDTYTKLQLSGHADYQRISYCEGGVVNEGESNVFTIESFDYTVYPNGTELSTFVDNVELFDNNALFAGDTLTDEEVDLSNITDINGNKNLTENTAFILAVSKFNTSLLTAPETLEYGMLISDEELSDELTIENCALKAYGVKNINGSYGILFHGNKILPGKTYYIRPYVYYNGNYQYGTTKEQTITGNEILGGN